MHAGSLAAQCLSALMSSTDTECGVAVFDEAVVAQVIGHVLVVIVAPPPSDVTTM